MTLNKFIGVFGGTFAPIHNGHVRLAVEALEQLQLDQVRLVPCADPPHRKSPGIPGGVRAVWAERAVQHHPNLVIDRRELLRNGHSYTVDTLESMRAQFGDDCSLQLLIGTDAANQFTSWRRWQNILTLAHLIVVERPGENLEFEQGLSDILDSKRAKDVNELKSRPHGLWMPLSIPPLPISSTQIRQKLADGQSIVGLVPDAVISNLSDEDIRKLNHD